MDALKTRGAPDFAIFPTRPGRGHGPGAAGRHPRLGTRSSGLVTVANRDGLQVQVGLGVRSNDRQDSLATGKKLETRTVMAGLSAAARAAPASLAPAPRRTEYSVAGPPHRWRRPPPGPARGRAGPGQPRHARLGRRARAAARSRQNDCWVGGWPAPDSERRSVAQRSDRWPAGGTQSRCRH